MAKQDRRGSGGLASLAELIPSVVAAAALVVGARRSVRRAPRGATTRVREPDVGQDVKAVAGSGTAEQPGLVDRIRTRVDRFQREHSAVGFPLGVAKKFGEDRAGHLAALVAYFGFFSVFPLMLAFTSVLGFVLTDPDDQREFAQAAADQIPVVGSTIRETAGQLNGSTIAVVVGLSIALWSGLRIVDAMQNALNSVWDVPRYSRPNMVVRRLRSLLMLFLICGGLIASIAASNVARLVDVIPGGSKVAIWGGSALVSIALYLLAFKLLTDRDLAWRVLLPGAVFSGVCWWALQTFGAALIVRQQQNAGEAYGDFASILALLGFLFLAAQLSIVGAEISAVRAQRLWPRSLVSGHYTEADLRAFEMLASATRQQEDYDVEVRRMPRATT